MACEASIAIKRVVWMNVAVGQAARAFQREVEAFIRTVGLWRSPMISGDRACYGRESGAVGWRVNSSGRQHNCA